ncbi:MAG: hypothetical protein VB022_01365 [Rikenellaceae bacterium]|nr:hypothetical protein [Rikenellaceae bacterium]
MMTLERKSVLSVQPVSPVQENICTYSPIIGQSGVRQVLSETTAPVVASPGGFATNPCTANFHQKVLAYSLFRERQIGKFNNKLEQQFLELINSIHTPACTFFVYGLRRIII